MADGTVKIGTEFDDSGVRGGLSKLGSFAKSGFAVLGGAISAVSAGMAAAGGAAIKLGSEFESSFAKASTLFGDVDVNTQSLKDSILRVSDATGITANELNESLYSALSAGIPVTEDMSEATAFLESSAKLAKAGFTDMDTALSATAKTLNAYGLDVSEADRINKILIQTQNKGITTVGELGASLAQVTPTAAAFGVSFENVGAALANMTAAGTPTAQATTQLNSLIAELGKNGTIGAKSLEKATKGTQYAGKSFKELMDSGVPLNEVLDLIQKSADESGLSMVDMFSSIEAGKAALALSGENSEKFAENLEAMGTSADVVTEAYDKVSDTLQTKVEKIANSAKNLGIQVYNGIQEPLKGLADVGISYLDELSAAFQEGGIEGLVGAGAQIISDISLGIAQQLPTLIDTAVSFIDTFVVSLNENMPQLLEAGGRILMALAQGVLQLIPSLASLGWSIVSGVIQSVQNNSGQIGSTGSNLLGVLADGIRTKLPELAQHGMEAVGNFVTGLLQNLPDVISTAGDIINTLLDAVLAALPQLLASGVQLIGQLVTGIVQNIPAIASAAGEVIGQLIATIVSHLPEILAKGIELIGQLAAGIIQAIPTVIGAIPQVISGIKTKFTEINWGEVGRNIIDGIKTGVANAAGLLIDAVKDVAEKALNGLKSFLGIHSPSRVFRDEVGKNIALGIAEGIVQNKEYAKKSLEEVASAILQAAKKKLDNEKVYRELSLADEVAYWDSVRRQVKEGTQARIDADKEYLTKKKSLNQKMASIEQDYTDKVRKAHEDLEKSIQSLREDYRDELTSRTQDLMGSMGLFDAFTATTELSTEDLLNNLHSQVMGMRDWSNNLKALERRGVTGDMLDELREMGTEAAGEVAVMTQMTDEQLDEYISLWKEKQRTARKEARRELEPMLEDTEDQISRLRTQTESELARYKQEYVDAMREIGVEIQQPLQQIQSSLLSMVSQAVALVAGTVSGESDKQNNVSQFAELANSLLNASSNLPQDFSALGQDTVAGMIQGLQMKQGELYSTMAEIIRQAVQTAKDEAQINSPSRLMRDMIGRNMIAGIGVGFDLESDELNHEAREVIHDAASAMRAASAKEFVSAMQGQAFQMASNVDKADNYRSGRADNTENGGVGKLVLEKSSIEVPVIMEGKAVAKVTAPHTDKELSAMSDKKGRGN